MVISISAIDEAGVKDPTPGSITLQFTAPLPVILAKFTATREGKIAHLAWSTTAETNSERFDVQRSKNGKDWNTIASIAAKGESNDLIDYSAVDTNPYQGENLYRLKMVDFDGTFAYSRIKSLIFETVLHVTTYPNPATNTLTIKMDGIANWDEVKSIKLVDSNGREAYTSDKNFSGEINVSMLPSGLYTLTVTHTNGSLYFSKIIIVK